MEIEALLQRHGIPLLGCAHTAFAIERFGDAFKVGFDVEDGWPAWAGWCQANPSPHAPVVHACHWIGNGRGARALFVGHVERLYPTIIGSRWIKACPAGKRDPLVLAEHVEAEHPGVARLLRAAREAFPAGHFDMGGPNWLERSDGTVVLNDPLSRA